MDTIKSGFGKEAFTLGGKSFSYGDVAKVGIPAAALYKSFSDAAKAPKAVPFYGANVNYADPRIYSQVGPQKFKVGQYDDAGNMTVADICQEQILMCHLKRYMLREQCQQCLMLWVNK